MAMNFNQTGPCDQVKVALDALTGLTDPEKAIRTNCDAGLDTHGEEVMEVICNNLGWSITPPTGP